MDRRAFISGITGGLLAAPLAAEAQPIRKTWRIGYLVSLLVVVAGVALCAGDRGLRIVASISVGCLCLTATDLALRALGDPFFSHRPEDRFLIVYPALPLVTRFQPHVRFVGEADGVHDDARQARRPLANDACLVGRDRYGHYP